MDIILWIIIIGAMLSALCGVIWWIIVFFSVNSAATSAQRDLDRLLPNIEYMLRQAPNTSYGQLNPHQQAKLVNMMMKAQNQMHQLEGLHRQHYENRVGELMSMASSAGIDCTAGSY